jgi:hypothetical protein
MRVIGTIVLAAGIAGAGLLYWLETHNAEPTLEDLMPGTSRANSRMMGVFYGHAGEMMWELREALARPDVQAGLVLAAAAIVSAICFRIAWVDGQRWER